MNNFKIWLLLFAGFLSAEVAHGQDDAGDNYNKFTQSLIETVCRTYEYGDTCTQVVCMVKVELKNQRVIAVQLSDSAGPGWLKRFNERKENSLNLQALEQYIRHKVPKGLVSQICLIPFYFSVQQPPCPPIPLQVNRLKNEFSFDGKYLEGSFFLLDTISRSIVIHQ